MIAGKDGLLELELLPDGPGFRRVRAPLSLGRVLHTDPESPHAQVVYIRATGGGLAQGDRLRTDITVRSGAHAIVTSQAAMRIHSMSDGSAEQHTYLKVDRGGVLEYLPDPIIASRASRFSQETTLHVADGAIAIIGDSFTAGRIAHGEFHDADAIDMRAELHTDSSARVGAPAFIERAVYRGKSDLSSPITHGNYKAWANLWVACPPAAAEVIVQQWRDYPSPLLSRPAAPSELPATIPTTQLCVGASLLPDDTGCWARFMGDSIEEVTQLQFEYWHRARQIVLGKPAFDLRKI